LLHYIHTLRHLKTRQIAGQIRAHFRMYLENPKRHQKKNSPPYPGCIWETPIPLPPANGRAARQSEAASGKFTFLNRMEPLGWPPNWDNSNPPKLWQYNLHYFDWIHSLESEKAREATVSWIQQHTLERRRVGWEPYPTSLRLMNWTLRFFGPDRKHTESDSEFADLLWKSLFLQTSWLQRHLEYHLMANHLFENAAALCLAGSCFDGPDARKWLAKGLSILRLELKEQILEDGYHFERSPMYHSRILYVLLLLASSGNPQLKELVKEPVLRMIPVLAKLTHPDSQIALLNDSAFGIYAEPKELFDYAGLLFPEAAELGELESGCIELKDAGYYGWRTPEGHYLVCNAGPICPDYQPGHSHADIFSFELSLHGQRIIVDSGVTEYEPGPRRTYCRSTWAHNTVEIADKDQSEMWGAFRVARRARVTDLNWEPREHGFTLQANHSGYSRIRWGLHHSRRFECNKGGHLRVTDSVKRLKEGEAVSRLHLHPECIIEEVKHNTFSITRNNVKAMVVFCKTGYVKITDGEYYPEFGKVIPNKNLAFYPEVGINEWEFEIYPA